MWGTNSFFLWWWWLKGFAPLKPLLADFTLPSLQNPGLSNIKLSLIWEQRGKTCFKYVVCICSVFSTSGTTGRHTWKSIKQSWLSKKPYMKPLNPCSLPFTLNSPVCFLWLGGNERRRRKKKGFVNCLCLTQKIKCLPGIYSLVKWQQKLLRKHVVNQAMEECSIWFFLLEQELNLSSLLPNTTHLQEQRIYVVWMLQRHQCRAGLWSPSLLRRYPRRKVPWAAPCLQGTTR